MWIETHYGLVNLDNFDLLIAHKNHIIAKKFSSDVAYIELIIFMYQTEEQAEKSLKNLLESLKRNHE
jgi:hypothetical protein